MNAGLERQVEEAGTGDLHRRHAVEVGGGERPPGRPRAGCGRATWPAAGPRSPGRRRGRTGAPPGRRRARRRRRRTPAAAGRRGGAADRPWVPAIVPRARGAPRSDGCRRTVDDESGDGVPGASSTSSVWREHLLAAVDDGRGRPTARPPRPASSIDITPLSNHTPCSTIQLIATSSTLPSRARRCTRRGRRLAVEQA